MSLQVGTCQRCLHSEVELFYTQRFGWVCEDCRDKPPATVTVIHLWEPEADCHVCEERTIVKQGIPIYEGDIVPDDYQGDWGGVPVCPECFALVRRMQAVAPGTVLAVAAVRLARHVESR